VPSTGPPEAPAGRPLVAPSRIRQGGRWAGQRSIYTGAKPETANVYFFQSLIAMKDTGTVRSTYLRESVDRVVQGALVLLTIAVVAVFWTLCRAMSRCWRTSVLFSIAVVVLGIRTLSEQAWRQHLSDVLWTLVLATVAALIWDTVTRGKPLLPTRAAAPPPPEPESEEPEETPPPDEEPEEPAEPEAQEEQPEPEDEKQD
jgi:hypothetical protein